MKKYLYKKLYILVNKCFDKSIERHTWLCKKTEQLENRDDKIFQKIILSLLYSFENVEFRVYRRFYRKMIESLELERTK